MRGKHSKPLLTLFKMMSTSDSFLADFSNEGASYELDQYVTGVKNQMDDFVQRGVIDPTQDLSK